MARELLDLYPSSEDTNYLLIAFCRTWAHVGDEPLTREDIMSTAEKMQLTVTEEQIEEYIRIGTPHALRSQNQERK